MKRSAFLLILGLLVGIGGVGSAVLLATPPSTRQNSSPLANRPSQPDFLPGQVLVRFRLETTLAEMKQALEVASATDYRELTPWGLYRITFPDSTPVGEAMARLEAFPFTMYAEPNYLLKALTWNAKSQEPVLDTPLAAEGGITVAVIDSSFDLRPPVLRNRLFTNFLEQPDDGVDNDQNGYTDDFQGYDFYRQAPFLKGETPSASFGMQATLRALREAEEWDPTLLPLRAGSSQGLVSSAVLEAITYAVRQKVRVIHLSFGDWWSSRSLADAIRQATQDQIVLVTAPYWSDHLRDFPQVLWATAVKEGPWEARFGYRDAKQVGRVPVPQLLDSVNGSRQGNHLRSHRHISAAPGVVGGAAQFDPEERQYLSIPDNPSIRMENTSFSIALWVYFDTLQKGSNPGIVVKAQDDSTIEYALYVETYPPNIRFLLSNSGEATKATSEHGTNGNYEHIDAEPIVAHIWYFVVATYDAESGQLTLYQNNRLQRSGRLVGRVHAGTAPLYVGRLPLPSVAMSEQRQCLHGRVDELGIWKRVLTEQEQADLYNLGKGNRFNGPERSFLVDSGGSLPEGLVAYYSFGEDGYRWRLGKYTVDPYRLVGLIGFCIFLLSSAQWVTSLFHWV